VMYFLQFQHLLVSSLLSQCHLRLRVSSSCPLSSPSYKSTSDWTGQDDLQAVGAYACGHRCGSSYRWGGRGRVGKPVSDLHDEAAMEKERKEGTGSKWNVCNEWQWWVISFDFSELKFLGHFLRCSTT
jgi:hypothetical protein